MGLPVKGLRGNVNNLSAFTLQKFQLENITPNRIFICGAGIDSHDEFVDLVNEKVSSIAPGNEEFLILKFKDKRLEPERLLYIKAEKSGHYQTAMISTSELFSLLLIINHQNSQLLF